MAGDWSIDAELLDAWRAGDLAAGTRLFDRHADAVARFFGNKVTAGAAELAQLSAELCELSGVAIPVWIAGADDQPWGAIVEVLAHALPEGICDGGIVVASNTRPERCDAAVAPSSLAAKLERGDQIGAGGGGAD